MKYSIFLGLLIFSAAGTSADIITLTPFTEVESEDSEVNWARFQLFYRCRPMELEVSVNSEAKKIGVTEESIRIIAESRLRSARLYTTDGASRLGVYVEGTGACFTTGVVFKKLVLDFETDKPNLAPMWQSGATIQSKNKNFVLNMLSQLVDRFLVEYLRVNETACGALK